MAKLYSKLTAAEVERLMLLAEECGEVVQIVGKIIRHGYESYHPHDPKKTSNRRLLQKELGDITAARRLMFRAGDICPFKVNDAAIDKLKRVKRYLHHQPERLFKKAR